MHCRWFSATRCMVMLLALPTGSVISMHGVFTDIYLKHQLSEYTIHYTIHGSHALGCILLRLSPRIVMTGLLKELLHQAYTLRP